VAEDEDMRGRAEGDCAVGVLFDQHPNGHSFAMLRGEHARKWSVRVVASRHVCFGGRMQLHVGLEADRSSPHVQLPYRSVVPGCCQGFFDGVLTNATDVEISG
jgi:hypothetical protein